MIGEMVLHPDGCNSDVRKQCKSKEGILEILITQLSFSDMADVFPSG